ncbi:beta-N-acetylhexosaminidase [Streptomyces griseoaurantiacus]|uniref:beta-N-acetylhexosaminidase n=1 Tax=Streptomyces griseoaurantiacus TaxID=68213 RepID=A0A7W2HVP8_9ACTN|nr:MULTISPECIES: beta-N-acetylhexosaminidase [Streptomyces]MBA5223462.1 beta-N-acetylhexosaminidase [Streptomyces griseoaurantiacus]MDX3090856.1 beta-N-acetylhexosaminidase [Streptomyces sp. ME12-02E]MDX3333317.1 beta-N-acetylhexosaminidase [Streptomyces sp. ME02-6978a]
MSHPAPPPALVPAPRRALPTAPGRAPVLDADTTIEEPPGTTAAARWLRGTLGPALGLPLPPHHPGSPSRTRVRLALVPALTGELGGPEGYRLDTTAHSVTLTAAAEPGLLHAAQTLRQLLGPEAFRRAPVTARRHWPVPAVTLEDGPRFRWRGLMLDVARHFLPKDGVLRYLDLMAAHKLNVLHLHLTDDQGWRIEIRSHPRLTEVGSWRPRTKIGHRASALWEEKPHGGFYTRDDLREIVAYAAARHIAVVPEIDIPGHSQAAIAAYPELGNTDVVDTSALGVWDDWGISPHVLAPTDTTLRFYEEVLEEVLELFPPDAAPFTGFSRFVHIGGDECPKDEWRRSPAAQARIRDLGLDGEDGLQAWFVRHFDDWLTARGRRLIGWDEILEGGLAPGAAVSSWRGYEGGITAARAGHDVVMCPERAVYLDHRQDPGPEEPVPIGFVRTLEDVHRFAPVPPELTEEQAAHVLGAQANVWTEVMEDQGRVDYQAFPRLAAFAEALWSPLPPPAERDFAEFESRMAVHYARLDALGVAYRPPGGPRPWQRRPGVRGRPR